MRRRAESGQRNDGRAALYVVGLGWKRVRRRSSGALLAAAGIAVGTAVLVGVLAGTKIAQDRSVSQAVETIPAAQRSVRAVWFGVPSGAADAYPALDRRVRAELARVGLPGPTPIVLVRESTIAERFVSLAAVDGLAPYVRLTSGRLPRTCTPARCEVVRLRGAGRLPSEPGLRLVQVGTGALRSSALFGDFLAPTDNALDDREIAPALQQSARYHRPAPAPLVVAEGVDALTRAPAVAGAYRSYAWVWPLAAGRPRLWQIGDLVGRSEQARAGLATASSGYAVETPVEELRAAERAADTAGRRLLLVGGEAAALLFAFAVLAARTMRRDLEAARRRLTWYGARRRDLRLLTLTESAVVAAWGVVCGWVVGLAAAALAALRSGAPVGGVLRQSILSPTGLGLAVLAVVLSTAVVAAATSTRRHDGGRFGALDAAALVALAVVVAALVGGAADASSPREGGGSAIVLLLLPGLIAFAAAVAAARLFGPLVRLVGRVARGGVGARLATVTLGRGPGAAGVTVAFLTLAFALALLAEGYRATLVQAEGDQAAFQVPLDVLVREDYKTLVPVLDAAPLARYARIAGGSHAVPVLRVRASAGNVEGVSGITVLGLPSAEVPRLGGWRESFSGTSRSRLAAAVTPPDDMTLRGVPLGDRLAFNAGPGLVALRATIASPDGRFAFVDLGSLRQDATTAVDVAVPPRFRGGRLVALELVPPRLVDRGADAGRPLAGTLRLSGLRPDGWLGQGGVQVTQSGEGVDLTFRISQQDDAVVRVRQPTDDAPPAVLVTPRLGVLAGGEGGTLALAVGGGRVMVRVAGIVDHFPSTTGDAVIGDVTALSTAIDAQVPGAGRPSEVWLDVPEGRDAAAVAALERPPFAATDVVSRAALLAAAHDDPLGHGTLIALDAAAVVALVLAALGLALTVLTDLRDERGDLYDLEAQGAEPSLLRRIVRVRALVVGVAGVAAGAVAGAVLALLVTRVVAATARTSALGLPLRTAFDLRVVLVGAVVYLLVAAALVVLATRRSFRDDRGPLRAQELGT